LTDALGFLFTATLVVLLAAGAYAWALSRVARLRGVRFENERIQRSLPWRLRWLGRERLKYFAAPAREALAQDPRRPVVWLRSFQIDERDAENIIAREVPLTFEEVATGALSRYGPVVAIGRPSEELPPLGALREYVGDDWQSRVRELLSLAAIIVIVFDDTPGLLWELRTVMDLGLHQRLIVLIPPNRVAMSEALAEALREEFSFAASQNSGASKDKLLAVVFYSDLVPERIIAGEHWAEYYHDAVELGAWFVTTSAQRAAPARTS
jgi:hypothetical protein